MKIANFIRFASLFFIAFALLACQAPANSQDPENLQAPEDSQDPANKPGKSYHLVELPDRLYPDPYEAQCAQIDYLLDGKIVKQERISYNKSAKIQEILITKPDTDYQYKMIYQYNTQGQLATRQSLHGNKKVFEYSYNYNLLGQLTNYKWSEWLPQYNYETDVVEPDQKEVYSMLYDYDETGQMIAEKQQFYTAWNGHWPGASTHHSFTNKLLQSTTVKRAVLVDDPVTGRQKWQDKAETIDIYNYTKNVPTSIRHFKAVVNEDQSIKKQLTGESNIDIQNGKLHKIQYNDLDGKQSSTRKFDYDQQGRIKTSSHQDASGLHNTVYHYGP